MIASLSDNIIHENYFKLLNLEYFHRFLLKHSAEIPYKFLSIFGYDIEDIFSNIQRYQIVLLGAFYDKDKKIQLLFLNYDFDNLSTDVLYVVSLSECISELSTFGGKIYKLSNQGKTKEILSNELADFLEKASEYFSDLKVLLGQFQEQSQRIEKEETSK